MRLFTAFPVLAGALLLAGCTAAGPGAGGDVPIPHPAADRLVSGQGTVLQSFDDPPQLCLGAIAESYPPQCSGPEIIGWDWSTIELKESVEDVTWGAYAVIGLWDGERFDLKEPPIPLALYDPMPQEPDPRHDPANAGKGTDAELDRIQRELFDSLEPLIAGPDNGYLFVTVIFDDGSIQEYVDEKYGPDLVVIESALTPLDA